jgi:hypothetical protein
MLRLSFLWKSSKEGQKPIFGATPSRESNNMNLYKI